MSVKTDLFPAIYKELNMITLPQKFTHLLLGGLVLLLVLASYQAGKHRTQKELATARADLAQLKARYAENEAAQAEAYAAALKKANEAALAQQNKTATISTQLIAANARTKNHAKQIKEVIENETNDSCAVLDADSVRIYNAALGY